MLVLVSAVIVVGNIHSLGCEGYANKCKHIEVSYNSTRIVLNYCSIWNAILIKDSATSERQISNIRFSYNTLVTMHGARIQNVLRDINSPECKLKPIIRILYIHCNQGYETIGISTRF